MWMPTESATTNALNAIAVYLLRDEKQKSLSPIGALLQHHAIVLDPELDRPDMLALLQTFQADQSRTSPTLEILFGLQRLAARLQDPDVHHRILCLTTEVGQPSDLDLSHWYVAEEINGPYRFIILIRRDAQIHATDMPRASGEGIAPAVLADTGLMPRGFHFLGELDHPGLVVVEGQWTLDQNCAIMKELVMEKYFSRGIIADPGGRMARLFDAPAAGSYIRSGDSFQLTMMLYVHRAGAFMVRLFPAWSLFAQTTNEKGLHNTLSLHYLRYHAYDIST